tara:strand:+ start:719 stop:964 length:246 start_codon:yes stop_codon:yes gene_type:complete
LRKCKVKNFRVFAQGGVTSHIYGGSMKVYVLKIGYNPNTDEVEYIKEYIEGAKATLEVDGKEIELDDEIGDLIVSDEMGLA